MSINSNIILSFDLDFTLINNREGILNSFKHALVKHGVPLIEDTAIEEMIGIPLNEMFENACDLDPSLLSNTFREYYGEKGIYQVKMFPGAREKLLELKKESFLLGIVTSKKQEMAKKLLEYLEIDGLFEYIIGETEEIKSKLDPKLKELLLANHSECKFVIIGDHPKDKALSDMLDCPFIGVLTGHFSENELSVNGNKKILILNSVKDITVKAIQSLFKI